MDPVPELLLSRAKKPFAIINNYTAIRTCHPGKGSHHHPDQDHNRQKNTPARAFPSGAMRHRKRKTAAKSIQNIESGEISGLMVRSNH